MSFQSVALRHQLKIARDTLKMPDAMVGVMGGMDKREARTLLKRHHKTSEYRRMILQLEGTLRYSGDCD